MKKILLTTSLFTTIFVTSTLLTSIYQESNISNQNKAEFRLSKASNLPQKREQKWADLQKDLALNPYPTIHIMRDAAQVHSTSFLSSLLQIYYQDKKDILMSHADSSKNITKDLNNQILLTDVTKYQYLDILNTINKDVGGVLVN